MAADVVVAAFREMNYEPEIVLHQWAIVNDLMREKKFVAGFPYARNTEREEYLCFPDSRSALGGGNVSVYFRLDRPGGPLNYDSIRDTGADLRIGRVRGYHYPQGILDTFSGPAIFFPDEHAAFEALLHSQTGDADMIDAFPARREVATALLDTFFGDARYTLDAIDHESWTSEFYLVVPRRRGQPCPDRLLDAFEEGYSRLRDRGLLGQLMRPYRNRDAAPKVRLRPSPNYPIVWGFVEPDSQLSDPGSLKLLIPSGVSAQVLEWCTASLGAARTETRDPFAHRSRVRITEGPSAGSAVWVPHVFIESHESHP